MPRSRAYSNHPQVEELTDRSIRNDVNMIIGGLDKNTKTNNPEGSCTEVITFTSANARGAQYHHHDLVVVSFNIDDCNVQHVLMNSGSSMDILFYGAFLRMNIPYND